MMMVLTHEGHPTEPVSADLPHGVILGKAVLGQDQWLTVKQIAQGEPAPEAGVFLTLPSARAYQARLTRAEADLAAARQENTPLKGLGWLMAGLVLGGLGGYLLRVNVAWWGRFSQSRGTDRSRSGSGGDGKPG